MKKTKPHNSYQRTTSPKGHHRLYIRSKRYNLFYLGIMLFLICSATNGIPLIGQEASVQSRGIKSRLPIRDEVPDRTPASTQDLNYVDLNTWTQTGGNSNWNIEPGGRTVLQTINGSPAFFVTPDEHINVAVQGTIAVLDMDSWQDDDFIGFVFGYKRPTGQTSSNDYEFILFDWRRAYSDYKWLSRCNGTCDLWSHTGAGLTVLATNTNTGGWQFDRTFDFRILYLENRVRVSIDGVTIFDVAGSFQPGKFGFYNYSQSYVRYGNILYGPGSLEEVPPIATADTYGMNWNTTLTKDSSEGILANDYDPNLDPFTIHLVDDVDHGTLVLDYDDGSFTYTPTTDYQGPDTFSYYLSDNDGNSDTVTVEISIMEPNQAPTDIYLSNNQVAAGSANGTSIGNFSTDDPNSSDSHDYMLIDNGGGRFGISGSTLQVANSSLLDPGVYTITVRSTDLRGLFLNKDFDITVSVVNSPPTDINLAPSTITENSPGLTVIGILTTTDATPSDTHTYTLLEDNGGRFDLQGNQVRLSASGQVDYETAASHQIQVRTTDTGGLTYDKNLTISVLNANESPTDISLSNNTVSENSAGAVVGSLSASDPDAGDSAVFSITLDSADLFEISGTSLKLQDGKAADYENAASHTIQVRVTDGGSLTFDKEFSISVLDVNDPPVLNTPIPDQTATEDQAFAYSFPADTFQDPDSGDTLGYTATLEDDSPLPAWLSFNAGSRTFSGTPLEEHTGTITVKVTADDGHDTNTTDSFVLTITAVNDAPVLTLPGAQKMDENRDHQITGISVADPDIGDEDLKITLSCTKGTLSLAQTSGLAFTAGNGSRNSAMTFSGTAANINQALSILTYSSQRNYYGQDTIEALANDQGHTGSGGALTDAGNILVRIENVNSPPEIQTPRSVQGNEDEILLVPGIAVDDVDAGEKELKVHISAKHGKVTARLAPNTLATGQVITNRIVSFTGSIDQINLTLETLDYIGIADYNGEDAIIIHVDDLGNTGPGGPKAANSKIPVILLPVNDAPTADAGEDKSATERTIVSLDGSDSSDPDGDELTFRWTQLEGSPVTLTGADTAHPSLMAPEVGIRGEKLVFKLEIEDPDGLKDSDTVVILIGDPSFRLFFLHTDCSGEREAEIGLINLSPYQPLEGELQAFDSSGRPIAAPFPVVLGPSGHRTVNIRQRYAEAEMVSYLVFTSSSKEVRGYTKYFAAGQYGASVPAACHINTGVVFLSNIASTDYWTTEIALLNPASAPSTLTFSFDNGQIRSVTVGAGELIALTIREIFGGIPQPDIHCGLIQGAEGFMGITLIGTPQQLSAHELDDLSTDTLIFPYVGADTSLWNGIAVFNPSDLPCDLRITPYSSEGVPLASRTTILQGHEQYSLARSYQDPSPLTSWMKVASNGAVLGQAFIGTYDSRRMSGYSNSGSAGKAGYFPSIDNPDITRLVLVNTENAPAVVTLTAYGADGRSLAERTLRLSAWEQTHDSATTFFNGQNLAGTTHIGFTSSTRITGFQIMNSGNEAVMDLLPCVISDIQN